MTSTRLTELSSIFATGKRSEVIAAGNELIAKIQELQRRRDKNIGPLLREVIEYGREIGLSMDEATAFHDYHTARGWKMGKSASAPMRDWKAALRLWKRNCIPPVNGNGSKPQNIGSRFGVGA